MARQPYMGLGLLFPRLRGLVHLWQFGDRPTGRAFQLDPDVTARAIWQAVTRLADLFAYETFLFIPVRFFYMP
jgi:hypothetical protein